VLKRIFGPKRGEGTGGWRKLRNEELHTCALRGAQNDQVKEGEMGRACNIHAVKMNADCVLVETQK
jgi:hypothetical protein